MYLSPEVEEGGGVDPSDGAGGDVADDLAAQIKTLTTRLDEFRDNNNKLRKDNDTLTKKTERFGDLSPELIQAALASLAKTDDEEEKALLAKGDIEGAMKRRTEKMRSDFETQIGERDKKLGDRDRRLGDTLRADSLRKAIEDKKLRLRPGAFEDLDSRARGIFKANADLDALVPIADDQVDKLTVDKWIDNIVEKAGHLFEGGGGGGADGRGGGGVTKIKRSELNPTRFAELADKIGTGEIQIIED